jgi:hypothetical protein
LLKENAFLSKIPHAMNAKQRLFLETIAFSINSITLAHGNLWHKLASYHADDAPTMPRSDRVYAYVHAWSIVNHTHMLRGALRGLLKTVPTDFPANPIKTFLKATEAAYKIRNELNHLIDQIGNKAKTSSGAHPLLGNLGYCVVQYDKTHPGLPSEPIYIHAVMVMGGAWTGDHIWQGVNPLGRGDFTFPVDCIEFSSGKETLDISKLVKSDIPSLNLYFETEFKKIAITIATNFAMTHGIAVEAALAPQVEGPVPTLRFGPIEGAKINRPDSSIKSDITLRANED